MGVIQNCVKHKQPNASIQLFQCAHDKLGYLILANDPRQIAKSEEYVGKLVKLVAFTKVGNGVKRAQLTSLPKENDELFRIFATQVRSKAESF